MAQKVDLVVDTKGELCPMPVIRAKLAIEELASGQVIQLISTDPGSKPDVRSWTSMEGHKLLKTTEDKGVYTFWVQKG